MTVRTRIAPSPTGDPHVGTAYTALFNYCLARSLGGKFILRIEDTDQARSSTESEEMILEALRWTGLTWDEGPDIGGPCGPYRQSERGEIYERHARQLLDGGHAFHCFCTAERLASMRKAAKSGAGPEGPLGYDGLCQSLTPDEVQARLDRGESHVVRLKVPREGTCTIDDHLRGPIEILWSHVDMQVLVKSDGLPTYHLANVVDDHLMGITHVVRGEEWITSAPKHLLLYQCFGWKPPVLCHMPLLRNPDKSKLSKRKNPTSILYYERMGYLPEAVLNYLGMMAWSMPDGEEKFNLEQMVEHFDLDRISLGGPVFDVDKLTWLNGRWIRENLDEAGFAARARTWALNPEFMARIIPLIQVRTERFSDLGPLTAHFFSGLLDPTPESLAIKKLEPAEVRKILQFGQWRLDALPRWERDEIDRELRATAELVGQKLRLFLKPFFVAIGGKPVSTPLFDTMEILGRDLCRARVRQSIGALGAVSGKEEKRWRKELAKLEQGEPKA